MGTQNIEIVERYLAALGAGKMDDAPVATNVRFDNPVSGKGKGKMALYASLAGFLPAIEKINIIKHVSDGSVVVTQWEVDGVFGKIRVLELFTIRDGAIIGTESYFDPRPVFGGK